MKPKLYYESPAELQTAFYELIPLSRHMGVQIEQYSGNALTLSAPLSLNINHQESAFGGSLYALAVLAGWGLMQLKLSERMLDCNTVISGAEASYQVPVFDDLVCSAILPDDAEDFFTRLSDAGKATTKMSSQFMDGDKVAMELLGTYHVRQRKNG